MASFTTKQTYFRSIKAFGVPVALLSLGLFAISYSTFIYQIKNADSSNKLPAADGVVVLTGGAKRLEKAIDLFETSHGQRLLISGVARGTTRGDLGRLLNKTGMMFGCCVDIDRQALDTRGNAKFTARWARLNNFDKLLVVTSNYHMPRSLLLMKRMMPDVKLVGVPIQPPAMADSGFWSIATSPLVIREFAKYLAASIGVEPPIKSFRAAWRGAPPESG